MGRGEASTDEHAWTPAPSPISVDGGDVMDFHWPLKYSANAQPCVAGLTTRQGPVNTWPPTRPPPSDAAGMDGHMHVGARGWREGWTGGWKRGCPGDRKWNTAEREVNKWLVYSLDIHYICHTINILYIIGCKDRIRFFKTSTGSRQDIEDWGTVCELCVCLWVTVW